MDPDPSALWTFSGLVDSSIPASLSTNLMAAVSAHSRVAPHGYGPASAGSNGQI